MINQSTKTIAYKGRPWEFQRMPMATMSSEDNHKGGDPRDNPPWNLRTWFMDPRTGAFTQREDHWDGHTVIRKGHVPEGHPTFTKDEVEKAFVIAEETSCLMSEAALSVKGTDNYMPHAIQALLKGEDQALSLDKKPQPRPDPMAAEDVVFEDPMAPPKKKVGRPRKQQPLETASPE